ncbi:hypothetical protein H6F55_20810 [Phormidium sp. FACHB-322]|nr:hypothetical protein [Phormidium sp. FACHB-77]MBD2032431.1 hypothetical protein [Phormidium sp. FACHB-322]MBD2051038.1 hypothetical protein [Leptolyngbya sp. FACHB-60]
MFEGSVKEVMTLYTSVFSDCQVSQIDFYSTGELGSLGLVKQAVPAKTSCNGLLSSFHSVAKC